MRYRVYGYVPERHLPVVMVEKTSTNVETTYRLFGDHLGSLRAVVRTSDGVAVQWMRHGPWGEVEGQAVVGGFERVPFGFAGGIYETETGLVRFGAREYDPRTGRWLSKDEARFGGGENFYEYGRSDPVNTTDTRGRDPSPLRIGFCFHMFSVWPSLLRACLGYDAAEDSVPSAAPKAPGDDAGAFTPLEPKPDPNSNVFDPDYSICGSLPANINRVACCRAACMNLEEPEKYNGCDLPRQPDSAEEACAKRCFRNPFGGAPLKKGPYR